MMLNLREIILGFSVLFIIVTSGDVKAERDEGLSKWMFGYIEYLETLINRTEDQGLKYEISGLFKQLGPALRQIIKIESRPIRHQKLRKLLPELEAIENLLALVKPKNSEGGKSYRIDEAPFDKEILLTLYEELEGDKDGGSLPPPWYPQNAKTDTTTARPYKVSVKLTLIYVFCLTANWWNCFNFRFPSVLTPHQHRSQTDQTGIQLTGIIISREIIPISGLKRN